MGGKTSEVSDPSDYQFLDPTGQYGAATDFMQNQYNQNAQQMGQYGAQAAQYDSNAYMNQFMGQAAGLSNLVSGENSQLQQSLNAIAGRQANLGSEAALAAMPGAANSGAGMAAYGQAYADPFAQAQAQLQQNQLQGTLGLWGNAMNNNAQGQQFQAQNYSGLAGMYGDQANNALSNYGQMAQGYGTWYQPTYTQGPGFWDTLGNVGQAAGGLAGLAAAFA
jgi:hypothetical protein